MAILIDFFEVSIDFRRISGGFRKDFGRIFRCFFAFSSKAAIFKIRAPTQCFVRVEPLKINEKTLKICFEMSGVNFPNCCPPDARIVYF